MKNKKMRLSIMLYEYYKINTRKMYFKFARIFKYITNLIYQIKIMIQKRIHNYSYIRIFFNPLFIQFIHTTYSHYNIICMV